jgi:DNA repair protein RadC
MPRHERLIQLSLDLHPQEPGPPRENLGRFVRRVSETVKIACPTDLARYLQENIYTPFEHFDQEELHALLLNNKNLITHEAMIYRGTINTVQIRVAEILKEAVRVNAPAFVLSHCHPSGDPTPSPEDVQVTRHVREAGMLLDIELLDHIIVGCNCWVSLKERGLGFDPS